MIGVQHQVTLHGKDCVKCELGLYRIQGVLNGLNLPKGLDPFVPNVNQETRII